MPFVFKFVKNETPYLLLISKALSNSVYTKICFGKIFELKYNLY